MGFDSDAVNVLLIAWVRFVRDGEELSMSKRSGEFITLDELLERGRRRRRALVLRLTRAVDRASTSTSSWRKQAVGREPRLLRPVRPRSHRLDPAQGSRRRTRSRPIHSRARWRTTMLRMGLAKELLRLPDIVLDAAAERETQAITAFATELATKFHAYYRDRRVVDKDDPQTSAAASRWWTLCGSRSLDHSGSWGSPRPTRCRDLARRLDQVRRLDTVGQ